MNKLQTIKSKISDLSKEFWQLMRDIPPYCVQQLNENCVQQLNEISEIYELQNQVATLSNSSIASALVKTIKELAIASAKPNHETICTYLNEAIKDLVSGMDAIDVLLKYEDILYRYKGWL